MAPISVPDSDDEVLSDEARVMLERGLDDFREGHVFTLDNVLYGDDEEDES